jgi:peptidoglycan/LPS O-acetylase OafA/YrhL
MDRRYGAVPEQLRRAQRMEREHTRRLLLRIGIALATIGSLVALISFRVLSSPVSEETLPAVPYLFSGCCAFLAGVASVLVHKLKGRPLLWAIGIVLATIGGLIAVISLLVLTLPVTEQYLWTLIAIPYLIAGCCIFLVGVVAMLARLVLKATGVRP